MWRPYFSPAQPGIRIWKRRLGLRYPGSGLLVGVALSVGMDSVPFWQLVLLPRRGLGMAARRFLEWAEQCNRPSCPPPEHTQFLPHPTHAPGAGAPTLTALNLKPLVRSEAVSGSAFVFRTDSAGLGHPRDKALASSISSPTAPSPVAPRPRQSTLTTSGPPAEAARLAPSSVAPLRHRRARGRRNPAHTTVGPEAQPSPGLSPPIRRPGQPRRQAVRRHRRRPLLQPHQPQLVPTSILSH